MSKKTSRPTVSNPETPKGLLANIIHFSLHNKFMIFSGFAVLLLAGIYFAPFDWRIAGVERSPIAVDAIPDIGENQQIVFTDWPGRSPQDVENQISYPLTVSLMGMPGVKSVRSTSMFGFSTIYVIFDDATDFYWSRTRILEKLNSLPPNLLPDGVKPMLGPDSTGLGQVFWYTLEGVDGQGRPTGGWDADELRSIQDWNVRYALLAVPGVSEVASIGGFVKEYQVDADPAAMRAYGVSFAELADAVRSANSEVGARTLELNNVEYLIRSVGYVGKLSDIEDSVIKAVDGVPVYVKNVAQVATGPAPRRGILNKAGAETVGGVVTIRYGENPLRVIQAVKREVEALSISLPQKTLADGTVSKIRIVPFYDRTGLIYETLGTLNSALVEEILITLIVIVVMLGNLRISTLLALLLPGSVLLTFVAMKYFGVDANVVALAGIAIAIGEIVDVGIVISENAVRRLEEAPPGAKSIDVIYRSTCEVAGAVVTSVATTIVSFLPVFSLQFAEGKLFRPLAYTKTFAMGASIVIAIVILPPLLHLFFAPPRWKYRPRQVANALLSVLCVYLAAFHGIGSGWLLALFPVYWLFRDHLPEKVNRVIMRFGYVAAALIASWLLTRHWMPIGMDAGMGINFSFVILLLLVFFGSFQLIECGYRPVMGWVLRHKTIGALLPLLLLGLGFLGYFGARSFTGHLPESWQSNRVVNGLNHIFPGFGHEFVPSLDEGSFLFMPTVMPHASVSEVADVLGKQSAAIAAIPEVESAVGKAGRAESPLDPAPLNMIETIINYKTRYAADRAGEFLLFQFDPDGVETFKDVDGRELPAPDGKPYLVEGIFRRTADGRLIPDRRGRVFRQWRPPLDPVLNPGRAFWPGVNTPDDIWNLIVRAAEIPGSTSAPRLQPIQTRIVMLQSGMRAAMGMVIRGPDLASIEQSADLLAGELKKHPAVVPEAVIVDRFVGKPYIEIVLDRKAIARHGIRLGDVQQNLEAAIGGVELTTTVENRERYAIRVRYQREMRDSIEAIRGILVDSADGTPIPLGQLARLEIVRGPQEIKSENSFKIGYLFFDRVAGLAETDAVEQVAATLNAKLASGELQLPDGVSYRFAGNYENQLRSTARLLIIVPLALAVIFVLIYLEFRSIPVSLMIFSGIAVAWAGGFFMMWLYGTSWFMNFSLFGVNMRELFNIAPVNMSVTVWVGFLALFGIATDDAVIMATYIRDVFARKKPDSVAAIRANIVDGGKRRLRPCLMTTATTLFAFLPVLTATGKGAELMIPMAIPVFGGMFFELITMITVPLLYCLYEEMRLKWNRKRGWIVLSPDNKPERRKKDMMKTRQRGGRFFRRRTD